MRALAHTPAARRQRAYRVRRDAGVIVPLVRTDPLVIEALIAQAVDAGLTESEAEAESRDRMKVAAALAAINLAWAKMYLARRIR